MNGWTDSNCVIRQHVIVNLNIDVLCIAETHCANNTDNQPHVDGYKWYGLCRRSHNVRSRRCFGGVGIFVKDCLFNCFNINVISHDYDGILGIILQHKSNAGKFVVFSCYLPPEDSPWGRNADDFFNHLLSLIYMYDDADNIFISGDLNARVGDLQDYVQFVDDIPARNVVDYTRNSHGQCLIDFLLESKLCIANGRVQGSDNFTCISTKGKSVVDYFLVNHSSLVNCSEWKVITPSEALSIFKLESLVSNRCKPPDHSIVILKYNTGFCSDYLHDNTGSINQNQNVGNANDCDDLYTEFVKDKKIFYNDIPESFLNSDRWRQKAQTLLNDIDNHLNNICDQQNIDKLYNDFCGAMFDEIKENIRIKDSSKQTRKKFKFHKPFWTEELTRLWKVMRDHEKLYSRANGSNNMKRILRKNFLETQQCFDRCLRQTERKYYRNLADQLENINSNNPKEFWDHIKQLGPKKKTLIPMRVYNEQGSFISDHTQVLNKWEKDFYSLFNPIDVENEFFDNEFRDEIMHEKCTMENSIYPEDNPANIINTDITEDEIRCMIRRLKNNKSVGPDCIPNEVIKLGRIDTILLKLYQTCFDNGVSPSIWKKSIIVPIPKNSLLDPCIPLNYRGISLLSCTYKLYTSILNARLVKYNDLNNLIADEQNGFRKNRSCLDHIYTLTSIIRNRKNQNLDTFCAFIDYQKAFDWVNKDILLYKLLKFFNIRGKFYNAIKCLLLESVTKVRINKLYTSWFNVSLGVRQGDTLSPTLFSMYINDLVKNINTFSCGVEVEDTQIGILLYADDVVLIAPSESNLQKQLDGVNEWCRKWRLMINENKSQVVHFRKKSKQLTSVTFKFGTKTLSTVPKYKYLGMFLNEFLDFSVPAKILADAGSRALGGIINKLQILKSFQYSTFSKLYDTGVKPIIGYAAGVWCYKNFERSSLVQRRAIRYYLGVHRFAPTHAIEGDMGWTPSKVELYLEMFRLWNHLVTLPPDRITRKVFNWDFNLCSHNWASEICEVFTTCNCVDTFQYKNLCVIDDMQSLLMNVESNNWDIARHNKDKLRTYNMFKCNYEPEEYVYLNLKRNVRSLIAQFRCGILPLQIEVGRYRNVPVENRLCFSCTNKIEDEYHLLMECSVYDDLRSNMFNAIVRKDQNFLDLDVFDQFIEICSNFQIYLGKFLCYATERRYNIIYDSL